MRGNSWCSVRLQLPIFVLLNIVREVKVGVSMLYTIIGSVAGTGADADSGLMKLE